MTTLYATLGINPTATAAQIKAAYRKSARKHHPDKGGDEAKFKQIQHAYEALSDPERRARYDATGDTGSNVDNGDRELLSELMNIATQIIDTFPVESVDLVGEMTKHLNNAKSQCNQQLRANQKMVENRNQAIKRLTCEDSVNLISEGLKSQISQIETHSAVVEQQLVKIDKLIEMVGKFSYRRDIILPKVQPNLGPGTWYGGTHL